MFNFYVLESVDSSTCAANISPSSGLTVVPLAECKFSTYTVRPVRGFGKGAAGNVSVCACSPSVLRGCRVCCSLCGSGGCTLRALSFPLELGANATPSQAGGEDGACFVRVRLDGGCGRTRGPRGHPGTCPLLEGHLCLWDSQAHQGLAVLTASHTGLAADWSWAAAPRSFSARRSWSPRCPLPRSVTAEAARHLEGLTHGPGG